MAREKVKKLGELLIDFKYITREQLKKSLEHQKDSDKRLGDILLDRGYISEVDLVEVLEFQLGVERADLSKYVVDPSLAKYIPENIAQRYNAVPIAKDGDTLKVVMSDPSDLLAIDDMEMTSNLRVKPMIATKSEISKIMSQIYETFEDSSDVFDSLDYYKSEDDEPEIDELKRMVEDAPIVRLTNMIINQALQKRASDIHIEPQENIVRIRYRVDGVLYEHMTAPKYTQAALVSRIKIIADLDITKRRVPQDGRIAMNVRGLSVDMRVSTLPTVHGEKVVIRLLTKDESLINIENLGFSDHNFRRFEGLIEQPHGILLVTGPTGSGKSTTLIAALNQLNDVEKNIVTIEDPVEYQLAGINQVHAKEKVGLSFANTLRSILRQDPDIIMVGEIRDEETAQIAVRAALTGHLVLSTLHTNDSVSSVTRLVDMGIPPYLVASTVIGAMAQRLVRRLCNNCKEPYQAGIEEREFMGLEEGTTLYKAKGCNKCSNTGYKGRLAVQEILTVDDKVGKMIVKGTDEIDIKNYAENQGMIDLKYDGIEKVKEGLTSYQELARVIV
ncbi:MAG: type II secretion system ATPase GspE [Halanaerobiales bacterium]|nr:type II secretion system ATPase GspE [Halanaerobiales bacterium]